MLFVLGGNGTHAGANAIHNECRKRELKVSVVAVPKTIDNDIPLMDKTFGFDTTVEEARAINSAHLEACSAYHGIGLVKLMGRSSVSIAMHASLSSGLVDVCLIPEVPFALDGEYGVLQHLEHLLKTKGFCVVCVAEAAGQDLLQKSGATDALGDVIFSDIGVHMQQKIKMHFKDIGVPADVKTSIQLTWFGHVVPIHLMQFNAVYLDKCCPWSICWVHLHHFLHLQHLMQHSLRLPSHHRSHHRAEACEP